MSNLAYIEQITETRHKTGEQSKVVKIYDDFGQGAICLDDFCDTFYDDDFELLIFVMDNANEMGCDNIVTLIDHIFETESSISIEGTFYDWDEIKGVFDKHWMTKGFDNQSENNSEIRSMKEKNKFPFYGSRTSKYDTT